MKIPLVVNIARLISHLLSYALCPGHNSAALQLRDNTNPFVPQCENNICIQVAHMEQHCQMKLGTLLGRIKIPGVADVHPWQDVLTPGPWEQHPSQGAYSPAVPPSPYRMITRYMVPHPEMFRDSTARHPSERLERCDAEQSSPESGLFITRLMRPQLPAVRTILRGCGQEAGRTAWWNPAGQRGNKRD